MTTSTTLLRRCLDRRGRRRPNSSVADLPEVRRRSTRRNISMSLDRRFPSAPSRSARAVGQEANVERSVDSIFFHNFLVFRKNALDSVAGLTLSVTTENLEGLLQAAEPSESASEPWTRRICPRRPEQTSSTAGSAHGSGRLERAAYGARRRTATVLERT